MGVCQSLFESALSTLRFGNASLGAAECREKLPSLDNTTSEISKKKPQAADLSSAFAKSGGPEIDRGARPSPDFDLKGELLSGSVKVLTETDCPELHNKEEFKHTSCFYNYFSRRLVGNYENCVFAQHVNDRCLVSYKSAYGNLISLMGMGLVKV